MGRPLRKCPGGYAYHALNRGNGRMQIFDDKGDYEAFERILGEAVSRWGTRLCSYVLMPNHWHLVLWPRGDGELSEFVGWVTLTHTQRWHAHRGSVGAGHVYQGRFKSFPVEQDDHFLSLCRYVERNPLRAGLVSQAQAWRWGSLWRMIYGSEEQRAMLSSWPVSRPSAGRWLERVNRPQTAEEEGALQQCLSRGRPWGGAGWTVDAAKRLGLASTFRPRGRPKRADKGS